MDYYKGTTNRKQANKASDTTQAGKGAENMENEEMIVTEALIKAIITIIELSESKEEAIKRIKELLN